MAKEAGLLKGMDSTQFARSHWLTAKRPIRILLVQPPATGGVKSLVAELNEDGETGYKPPLGILYVGTYVQTHSNHIVKVVDCQPENLSFEDMGKIAEEFQPDLVGVSAWVEWWYPAYAVGKAIKEKVPTAHLTFGGPHVSIFPKEILDIDIVDSVIVGDGELPFSFLSNMIANNRFDNACPGLHIKTCGGVKSEPNLFFIQQDLDKLPTPNRTLLPIKNYTSVLAKGDHVTTMITSRGCPHKCTFCKLNFQKTLCRSADNIIAEFEEIQRLGIKEVEIYDDTFTWSRKRVKDICEGLIARNIKVEWAIRDRVSNAKEELLDIMYKAGCRRIHYGVESGVDRMLGVMKKRISTKQALDAVRMAKERKYTVLTYFMFGNLTETKADMEATIDFALKLGADYSEFSVTIPYPGTEMYDDALRDKLIPYDYWRQYTSKPVPDFEIPYLIESEATKSELIAMRDRAVRAFYFRPSYMIREAVNVRSLGELKRKAAMGLSLFRTTLYRARASVASKGSSAR